MCVCVCVCMHLCVYECVCLCVGWTLHLKCDCIIIIIILVCLSMVFQLKLFYAHPQSGALLYEKIDVHKDDTLRGATNMGYKVCTYVRTYMYVLCCTIYYCYLFCFLILFICSAVF